jgi:hypothetical protein
MTILRVIEPNRTARFSVGQYISIAIYINERMDGYGRVVLDELLIVCVAYEPRDDVS